MTGIALESIGYGIVWMAQRGWGTPIVPLTFAMEVVLAFLTVILALSSVWLVIASIHTLGKQWALAARIVEGHKLVTDGPYRFIRHPIYTGMFGMLIATGLAVSVWYAVIIAGVIFWIGTMLRVKVEEKLLSESFGDEFDRYAGRTAPLFPGFSRKK
jgi:protein-S-isoprenylcysteine O-methyltransferase Ste14